MSDAVLAPASLLPSSPFLAPWVLPCWHNRIRVEEAPDECRVYGRALVGPCWLWLGWNNGKGHGVVQIKGERLYLHRYSLASFHGIEVHALDTVDHLCRNRNCFNPLHVESVTPIENYRRGDGPAWQFKKPEEYETALDGEDLAAALKGY